MTDRPIILDTFCKAGGATKGYQRAGFYVVGVDIEPQPHYCGDEFIQADALEYIAAHGKEYDAIHASPPCQGYSVIKINADAYQKLIPEVRRLLIETGRPYVIENVEGARREMKNFVMLCGTMFGLRVRRHRLFECYPLIMMSPMSCCHWLKVVKKGKRPDPSKHFAAIYGHFSDKAYGREAMQIDWMSSDELSEAIPPRYTEYIGAHLLAALEPRR